MSILFENATILIKKGSEYEAIENGFLGIDGKYIDYIGKEKPNKKYDVVKDYSNKLLMPGLVNAHTHTPMVFLRGLGAGLPLQNWLNDYIFPTEAKLTPEIIEIASYYAILELLASGVTSFTDMYFFPEGTAKAVSESGIKANINKYLLCFDENQKIEDSGIPGSLEFFNKYHNTADGRLKVDFSIHAEYTNKPHIVKEYSRLCKENNGRMHIHLAETKKEVEECIQRYGVSPAKWFEDLGTFDNPTCAAHLVWPVNDDIEILKRHDVSIMHNPTSNMMLGSGFAPINKLMRNGINVGLGTDGTASNNNLNMFEEMHLCSILSDGFHLDPKYLTNSQVIDMATINGAKLQGRDDTGSLEVGKCADIIALDLNNIHLYPILNYPAIITKSAQAHDVCMTMVDGNVLYENGEYKTLDRKDIVERFKKAVEEFYQQ